MKEPADHGEHKVHRPKEAHCARHRDDAAAAVLKCIERLTWKDREKRETFFVVGGGVYQKGGRMFIARIRPAIEVSWEDEIGGYEKVYYIGDHLRIETKKGASVTGILVQYKEAEDDLMQDTLVIKTKDETVKDGLRQVGIHNISKIERCAYGSGMD